MELAKELGFSVSNKTKLAEIQKLLLTHRAFQNVSENRSIFS
jgi:hypothetical protein